MFTLGGVFGVENPWSELVDSGGLYTRLRCSLLVPTDMGWGAGREGLEGRGAGRERGEEGRGWKEGGEKAVVG